MSGDKACGIKSYNKDTLYTCNSSGQRLINNFCNDKGMDWVCKDDECKQIPWVNVTDITVNPEKKSINIGQSFRITVIVLPVDATNKGVSWKSSDSSVASVDIGGNVVAKKSGKAVITVYSKRQ
jgi:uncharacterized protein YjdB